MSVITLNGAATHPRRLRWREFRAGLNEWAQRTRSRYELTSLDERQLMDVGLTQADVEKESNKPFWQP